MSGIVKRLIGHGLQIEVRLQACLARLEAGTDDEALHDLRIAVRRLRSLLRPLRKLPPAAELDRAAQTLGRASSPLRDNEVLLAQLRTRDAANLLPDLPAQLQEGYAALLHGEDLAQLLDALNDWPQALRELQQAGQLKGLRKRLRRRMQRQSAQLREALGEPGHDRHQLRLLIKRLRYADEAYPGLLGGDPRLPAALKAAQSALGDWHDRWQWLARVPRDPALVALQPVWTHEIQAAERTADQALLSLGERLADSDD